MQNDGDLLDVIPLYLILECAPRYSVGVLNRLRVVPECWYVLSPTRKNTSSEVYQGRARFQQHRDASCHQVFFFLQGKAPKEIHAILTETLACFLPGRTKDLSAPLYLRRNAVGVLAGFKYLYSVQNFHPCCTVHTTLYWLIPASLSLQLKGLEREIDHHLHWFPRLRMKGVLTALHHTPTRRTQGQLYLSSL